MLGSSLLASVLLATNSAPAHAGLDRYVKKKKLDPLDTYVPLVLEARDVLAELDGVMDKDPSAARQQLRSGPFSGMRDNIRALGQYAALPAADGGAGLSEADAGQLVSGFFRALEDYDLLLYNAVREYKQQEQKAAKAHTSSSSADYEDAEAAASEPIDLAVGLDKAAAAEKLQLTVTKLDQLLATVPAGVMTKAEAVLAKVTGKKPATMAAEAS